MIWGKSFLVHKAEPTPTPTSEPIAAIAEEPTTTADLSEFCQAALSTPAASPAMPEHMPSIVYQPMERLSKPKVHRHAPHDEPAAGTHVSLTIGGAIREDHN